MLRNGLRLKTYHPVSLFSVVSKILEKPVSNRLADQRDVAVSDFQYGFKTPHDRIGRVLLGLGLLKL